MCILMLNTSLKKLTVWMSTLRCIYNHARTKFLGCTATESNLKSGCSIFYMHLEMMTLYGMPAQIIIMDMALQNYVSVPVYDALHCGNRTSHFSSV